MILIFILISFFFIIAIINSLISHEFFFLFHKNLLHIIINVFLFINCWNERISVKYIIINFLIHSDKNLKITFSKFIIICNLWYFITIIICFFSMNIFLNIYDIFAYFNIIISVFFIDWFSIIWININTYFRNFFILYS